MARALGMEVVAHNRTLRPELAVELGLTLLPRDDLLARSDFISLHLPLTPQTQGMIGARELALVKPRRRFCSTWDGVALVDEPALYQALTPGDAWPGPPWMFWPRSRPRATPCWSSAR